jgi:hypothetical protein
MLISIFLFLFDPDLVLYYISVDKKFKKISKNWHQVLKKIY